MVVLLYLVSLLSLALGSPLIPNILNLTRSVKLQAHSHVKNLSNLPLTHLQQKILKSCKTKTGDRCVFPFKYLGVTHYQCTYADSPNPWCATQKDSKGEVVFNKWGDCNISTLSSCQAESLASSPVSCITSSGPRPNQDCVFPFRYLGVTYTACTHLGPQIIPWCSTKTTLTGNHVEGEYGFCPISCPVDSECTPGSVYQQDCNTCVCNPQGKAVCSTLACPVTTAAPPAPSIATSANFVVTTPPTTTNSILRTSTTSPTAQIQDVSCSTVSGPATGAYCIFPFTYGEEIHTTCAEWVYGGEEQGKFWCSTKVDDFGVHVNGEGNFGFCEAACSTNPPLALLDTFDNLLNARNARNANRTGKSVDSVQVVFGSNRPGDLSGWNIEDRMD